MTGRLTLVRRIGQGVMGIVWHARNETTGSIVALKLPRGSYADDAEALERLTREVELARQVRSTHMVQALGYGTRDGA